MQVGESSAAADGGLPPPSALREDDPRATVVVELHDTTLPDGAVFRVEGLAEPLELPVDACAYGGSYIFVMRGCEEARSCRATLTVEGREHVLFEDVDLHETAAALAEPGGPPPEPLAIDWPTSEWEPEPEERRGRRPPIADDIGDENFIHDYSHPDDEQDEQDEQDDLEGWIRVEIDPSPHRLGDN